MSFTFVDLFAGIGGFHAALAPIGGELSFFSEINQPAINIYNLNWTQNNSEKNLGDIQIISNNSIENNLPNHHVLTGGFPCQPFSKSGHQRGVTEARGTLFYNILRIIEEKKPEIVLLENVRNLIGPKHINDYHTMIRLLRDLGYITSSKPTILSPHEIPHELGGTPQHRERVFIGGIKANKKIAQQFTEIDPIFNRNPFNLDTEHYWDLRKYFQSIDLSSNVKKDSIFNDQQEKVLEAWEEFLIQFRRHNLMNPPGLPLWSEYWTDRQNFRIPRETPDWKRDFIFRNHQLYLTNKKWIDIWKNKYEIKKFINSYQKFEWQARNEASIFDCLIQFRPSGIRVKQPNYVPTFVAMSQTPYLGWERRSLTVAEAASLQGFPKNFEFGTQKDSESFKQIGNAVHSGVARIVFLGLIKRARYLGNEWALELNIDERILKRIPLSSDNQLFD